MDIFNSRCLELKNKHDLNILFEEIYDDTALKGEYFLYVIKYKKAVK